MKKAFSFLLFLILLIIIQRADGQELGKEFSLKKSTGDVRTGSGEKRCGDYFLFTPVTGSGLIIFEYNGVPGFASIQIINIKTEIDEEKDTPTVEFEAKNKVFIRLSEEEEKKFRPCLEKK